MNKAVKKAENTERPAKKYPTIRSNPLYTQTIRINSPQAQRVEQRCLSRVSRALFSIDVILRIIGESSEVDELEDIITGHAEKVKQDFLMETKRLEKLKDDNGIMELPSYSSPAEFNVEIKSPQIQSFTRLLIILDELMCLMDCLWLNSVLTSRQRTEASYKWQQTLIKLSNRIISFESRARISADKKGKSEEVQKAAPKLDEKSEQTISENQNPDEVLTEAVESVTETQDAV